MWQLTHLKQLGCQHWLIARITLPTTNSPEEAGDPEHRERHVNPKCLTYTSYRARCRYTALTTATAAWGKQSVEVMGAVLPPLVLFAVTNPQ